MWGEYSFQDGNCIAVLFLIKYQSQGHNPTHLTPREKLLCFYLECNLLENLVNPDTKIKINSSTKWFIICPGGVLDQDPLFPPSLHFVTCHIQVSPDVTYLQIIRVGLWPSWCVASDDICCVPTTQLTSRLSTHSNVPPLASSAHCQHLQPGNLHILDTY